MKVRFDFNLSAWIKGIEIEADSIEEAEERLYSLDVANMIEMGYVDESDISDIDHNVLEKNYDIRVYNIKYVDKDFKGPQTLEVILEDVDADLTEFELEDLIADEIYLQTDHSPDDFGFDIIKEY